MPLLVVRTRQPELRQSARVPTTGMPTRTQTAVPLPAALYSSIMSSPSAQKATDTPTTNADASRSAITEHLSTVTARLQNSVAHSTSASFVAATGFTLRLGADPPLGRMMPIRAPIVTNLRTGVVDVVRTAAIPAFMLSPLFMGYLVPREAVGTKIGDRVALFPSLGAHRDE